MKGPVDLSPPENASEALTRERVGQLQRLPPTRSICPRNRSGNKWIDLPALGEVKTLNRSTFLKGGRADIIGARRA